MRLTSAVALALVVSVLVAGPSHAQPPADQSAAASGPARLRVYLDCSDCFQNYLRDEITWVDFVRQPQDADVHLLSNSQTTGGGGREVVLRFVGAGRFATVDHELRALSLAGETENVRRATLLRTVVVGLLNYMAREGLPAGLDVDVEPDQTRAADALPVRDPWNLWAFRIGSGGSIDAEESNRQVRWDLNLSADRVTDDWKISFGSRVEREREKFDLDEDDPFEVKRHETRFDWFLAKSLGPHWSFGFEGDVESSSFGNTRFSAASGPAIEFSIFPYREYATRQFVLQYQAGTQHTEYNEVTLFDKLEETRGRHEVSARLDQRQPWGSIESSVELSQYFHDLGKYRLEVNGEVSVRITRGLSVNFDGSASRIRDQISLPRRSATPEEVLLELRELQSGYEVSFSASVSYSFGSLFNNVVNPRFGNRD
jgi:hypothetical protein